MCCGYWEIGLPICSKVPGKKVWGGKRRCRISEERSDSESVNTAALPLLWKSKARISAPDMMHVQMKRMEQRRWLNVGSCIAHHHGIEGDGELGKVWSGPE